VLLRPGGVPLEDIEALIGTVAVGQSVEVRPASPGQLPRHYSPATPLLLTEEEVPRQDQRLGLLTWERPADAAGFAAVEVLSEKRCLREAATNLFAALRRLDAQGLDMIVARPVPEVGLGRAIMDRLRRAAAKKAV
jgi:L-threonylcarbamoyladenylate synthase